VSPRCLPSRVAREVAAGWLSDLFAGESLGLFRDGSSHCTRLLDAANCCVTALHNHLIVRSQNINIAKSKCFRRTFAVKDVVSFMSIS